MTVSPLSGVSGRPVRTSSEMALRIFFGIFLAVVAVALALAGNSWPFAAAIAVMTLFGAREWHRLVRVPDLRAVADHRAFHVQTAITAATIALALAVLMLKQVPLGLLLLGAGTIAVFVLALRAHDNPAWHAFGVLYLGLPALSLIGLRTLSANGALVILGLFLVVWATDTGALIFGRLIGGARLWPAVSPGKTWAGTLGGSLTAALVFALYAAIVGFGVLQGLVFALGLSVVAHLGDLFESWVKRRFGTKDSGSLIPGHGGVLDRMDSMFACSMVLALLVFGAHINPMLGGHA